MPRPHLWMLHGPTASGKTALAVALAKHLGARILNTDARQLYREMRIGVARPSLEELAEVYHHGIASHSIHDEVTAMSYAHWAESWVESELAERQHVVLVGGSGLYAKALLFHSDPLPKADPELRAALEAQWQQEPDQLVAELQAKDPVYAAQADLKNSRRVIRALEVIALTGASYSSQRTSETDPRPRFDANYHEFALWPDLRILEDRIALRTATMFDEGLAEEARALAPQAHLPALQTVGYREFYENPGADRPTLEALVRTHTRQYAKRQLTWIQKQPGVERIPLGSSPEVLLSCLP
jgi:tRNA dimethylallyltransferase